MAQHVLHVTVHAGNQPDVAPMDFSQADRYVVASVMAHTRPVRPKPYAESAPMVAIRKMAGTAADGALPKAAIPAGNDRTPAPTMPLTTEKTIMKI